MVVHGVLNEAADGDSDLLRLDLEETVEFVASSLRDKLELVAASGLTGLSVVELLLSVGVGRVLVQLLLLGLTRLGGVLVSEQIVGAVVENLVGRVDDADPVLEGVLEVVGLVLAHLTLQGRELRGDLRELGVVSSQELISRRLVGGEGGGDSAELHPSLAQLAVTLRNGSGASQEQANVVLDGLPVATLLLEPVINLVGGSKRLLNAGNLIQDTREEALRLSVSASSLLGLGLHQNSLRGLHKGTEILIAQEQGLVQDALQETLQLLTAVHQQVRIEAV